jgi:hypothetical protein
MCGRVLRQDKPSVNSGVNPYGQPAKSTIWLNIKRKILPPAALRLLESTEATEEERNGRSLFLPLWPLCPRAERVVKNLSLPD